MKKIPYLFFGVLILLSAYANAQDLDFKKIQVDFCYFGNQVINPGASLNLDWSFLHSENRRNVVHRRDAEITNIRHHCLNLNLNLGGFTQKPIQSLGFANLGLSYKKISGRLFIYEIGANAGYTRTFLSSNYNNSMAENDHQFFIPGAFYLTYHYYANFGKYFRKPFFIKGWTTGISVFELKNYGAGPERLYNLKLGLVLR